MQNLAPANVTKQSNEVTSNKVTENRVTEKKSWKDKKFQNRLKMRKMVWNSKNQQSRKHVCQST